MNLFSFFFISFESTHILLRCCGFDIRTHTNSIVISMWLNIKEEEEEEKPESEQIIGMRKHDVMEKRNIHYPILIIGVCVDNRLTALLYTFVYFGCWMEKRIAICTQRKLNMVSASIDCHAVNTISWTFTKTNTLSSTRAKEPNIPNFYFLDTWYTWNQNKSNDKINICNTIM